MDFHLYLEVLQEAIDPHGKPEIVNTDKGGKYASEIFVSTVLSNDIKLSIHGKGRAIE